MLRDEAWGQELLNLSSKRYATCNLTFSPIITSKWRQASKTKCKYLFQDIMKLSVPAAVGATYPKNWQKKYFYSK